MKILKLAALAAALMPAAEVMAATTGQIEASVASTVRPDGPRQFSGALSQTFFNIEGANNGAFASYGVARFDLGGLDLSTATIDSVSLELYESNAGFTTNGNVAVYYSNQDFVDISSAGTASAAYVANGNTPFALDFTDALFLGGDFFEQGVDGDLESFAIVQNLQSFADADGIITLIFAEFNDSDVAATYAGLGNVDGPAPTLTINYSTTAVPVPAAVWLFGSGLVGLVGMARCKAA